jgi:hypothetical protein
MIKGTFYAVGGLFFFTFWFYFMAATIAGPKELTTKKGRECVYFLFQMECNDAKYNHDTNYSKSPYSVTEYPDKCAECYDEKE